MPEKAGSTTPTPEVPAGYMEDAIGRLWPDTLVKDADRERDQLVCELAAEAAEISQRLGEFRAKAIEKIDALVAKRGKEYGVKMERGSVALSSFNGRLRLQVAVAERTEYDEGLQVGRELLAQCLKRWGRNASPKIRTLVREALKVDKKGQVDTRRLRGLRKLDMGGDQEWEKAMKAIADAEHVVRSRRYIRVQRRDADGRYESIPLSASGA